MRVKREPTDRVKREPTAHVKREPTDHVKREPTKNYLEDVFTHSQCEDPACPECRYRRKCKVWKAKLQMAGTGASWLVHSIAGAGCIICMAMGQAGRIAQCQVNSIGAMKFCNFEAHAKLVSHRRAVAQMHKDIAADGTGPDTKDLDSDLCPSKEDFLKVWDAVCKGNANGSLASFGKNRRCEEECGA